MHCRTCNPVNTVLFPRFGFVVVFCLCFDFYDRGKEEKILFPAPHNRRYSKPVNVGLTAVPPPDKFPLHGTVGERNAGEPTAPAKTLCTGDLWAGWNSRRGLDPPAWCMDRGNGVLPRRRGGNSSLKPVA